MQDEQRPKVNAVFALSGLGLAIIAAASLRDLWWLAIGAIACVIFLAAG